MVGAGGPDESYSVLVHDETEDRDYSPDTVGHPDRIPDTIVSALAKAYGLSVVWGSGYPVKRPHVLAIPLDYWTTGRRGYSVWVFPSGEVRPGYHVLYTEVTT